MSAEKSKILTSFPIWKDGKIKQYYHLEWECATTFKLIYYQNNGYEEAEHVVAVFEGHLVEKPNLYWFVDANPLETLKLASVERVAVAKALDVLNSDKTAREISGGVIH